MRVLGGHCRGGCRGAAVAWDLVAGIEAAVDAVLEAGMRTPDLAAGTPATPPMPDVPAEVEVGTAEMTDAVLAALAD